MGWFVTIEGPEGAGKSTLLRALAEYFRGQGQDVVETREPGAGEFGATIRRLLLDGEAIDPRAELFLFLADRAHHVASVVRPALARGALVLCDRHADSTVVYQGYGRGLDVARLREWNRFATQNLMPDRTLLLDLPVEIGLARLPTKNRLDAEDVAFHRRVRDGFRAEALLDPNRWRVLDATHSPNEVFAAALDAIQFSTATPPSA